MAVRQLMVAFAGEGSGEEELTWGQLHIWRAMQETGSSLAMGALARLPVGATVEQAAADLRFYLSRYESMRTRLRFGADGAVWQVVSASGVAPLSIVDSTDPEPVAAEILERDLGARYDYEHEWPMRMTVVRHRGVPTHLVVALCHLAADAMAVRLMMDELAARDPGTGLATGPVTGMTPRRLARLERTAAALRHNDAALRYWERLLRRVPARPFRPTGAGPPAGARSPVGACSPAGAGSPSGARPPASSGPSAQPFREVHFRSTALHLAVARFAAVNRVNTAPVLLAAFAAALSRMTGADPVAFRMIVSNRFRPGLSDVVAPVSQPGLLVLDIAGLPFADVVSRVDARALSAYKNAYYDPRRLAELRTRVAGEASLERIDTGCILNDRRMPGTERAPGLAPSPAEVRAAISRTELRWGRVLPRFNEGLMVNVNDVPSTVDITAKVDTRYLAPVDLEALLHVMEEIAVRSVGETAGTAQRVTST